MKLAAVEHADLEAQVARDELAARLREGLVDLARLADKAETVTRDQLWDLIVDLDAHTARAISFSAAELISQQREAQFAATRPAA